MSNIGSATSAPVRTGQSNNVGSSQSVKDAADTKTAASSSDQEPASAKGGSDSRTKVADHQLEGQMRNAQLMATAEREMNPVGPNTAVDITNKDMRTQLLRSAPQINPISNAAGNGPNICGAASVANALVLSSKTPEQAKANAHAVRDLAAKAPCGGVKLSAAEDAALKRMEGGKMSPTDVQHLQQVVYRIGNTMPNGGLDVSGGGWSTVQTTTTMSMLAKRGAFEGSSVTMHCNKHPMSDFDHWTTTVDGVHANSQGYDQKNLNKSFVQGGPPAGLARGTEDWRNEIWLNTAQKPAELHAHIKGPDDKGKEHRYLMIDTGKYDTQDVSELDFALRTGTQKVSE